MLLREKRVEQDEEGMLHETDEVPGIKDVFDWVRKKVKCVTRKYAFGEADVPKDASWLNVVYGFGGSFLLSITSAC